MKKYFKGKRVLAWCLMLVLLFSDTVMAAGTVSSGDALRRVISGEDVSSGDSSLKNTLQTTQNATTLASNTYDLRSADGTPTVVIAGSDYQNTNGGLFSSGASTDAYAIMSQIKEDYTSAYGFLFGGDYYAHNTNTTTESTNGKNQLKGEIVDVLYPDMADDTQVYIQGNHDADSLTTNGTLATSGAHDTDYYGVYVINEKDYMWYNDNQSTIQSTASALESYLDAKLDEGYSKPIFVLSHLPLHYTNRTQNEGDGKYAKYIYDVLDEAGTNDLNIIFLYGHNHSTAYDSYLGNGSVYLPEGSSIAVANEGSTSSYFTDTLTFTYMNYGFVGYIGSSDADSALTMTVFEITDNQVAVKRYDESGLHNLKAAGGTTQLPSGLSVDSTVIGTEGATIALTAPAEKATLTSSNVTVSAVGITEVTASKAEAPTYNASLYSGYEEYTVSAEGLTGSADVTIALTDGDFDTTRAITVKFPDGHTEDVSVSEGTITVSTEQLGTFTLMQKVQITIDVPSTGGDTANGTIWRQTTTMTAGKTYMLVNYGDNASDVGSFAVNSTAGGTAVTVQTDSTGAYIENSNMALAWTYNTNAELTNGSTGQYLYIGSYPTGISGVAFAVTGSVTTGKSYSSWKLATNTGVSETSLSAYRNGSSNYYPARWSNGGAEYLAYTSTQTAKHDNWIAVFEQTSEGGSTGGSDAPTVEESGGSWVTITESTGGTTTYTYELTDTIVSGESYLIGSGNNGTVNILNSNGNTISGTTTNGVFTTTSSVTDAHKWIFTGSDTSYTIQNVSTDKYLYPTASRSWNYWSYSLETEGSNSSVTVNNNSGALTISRSVSSRGQSTTAYMTNSFDANNFGSAVYLYKIVEHTSGGFNGLYGKLDGELIYNVPYGTSATEALDKVKDGITIKYATASDYSDEATFPDDGDGMTWTAVDYDPETPGEYAVNISYNGTLLGTAKIVVGAKPAGQATVTINSDSGIVRQNAGAAALTGNKLTVTYQDGTKETVNVTVSMVKNADGTSVDTSVPGTYTGLKVVYTYNGVDYIICNNYTLTVRENVQNNYPEYPDEGAVKVNKTATGIDFQSSGIAQVELSASGIPSKKGVDVIVMVDTSSSMKRGAGTNSEVSYPNRRIDFLQTALANLIREFQAVGDDGEQLDINVAIAEFNGYDFISGEDEPSDTSQQGASNVAEVFTGDGSKTAAAFVQATTIADPDAFAANIGEHSGTNYDYAFDTVYRLGSAINAQNEANGEDRDLFVVFMSDGAPYGYNYYGSGTTDTWDDYLNGKMTINDDGTITDDTRVYLKGNTHFYRTDGKHWMAEAIKGTTDQAYLVIDPTDSLGTDATAADYAVYSDAGITVPIDGAPDYMRMVSGLGAEMHTIGFCLYDDDQGSGNIVYATTQKALMQRLASTDAQGNLLYHETESGSDLNDIFCEIASSIAYAATNARFVDQMGDGFNLQLKTSTYTVVENGEEAGKTLAPVIEIGTYPIYTRQNYIDGLCTEDQIGDRTGAFVLNEVVKFSDDGTKAYSNLIDVDSDGTFGVTVNDDGTYTISDTDDNIIGTDGIIYAKTFMYNIGVTAVTVSGITLESEQFYWKLGTIQTSELALRYYVYLEGSMEGTKEAGSYPTNEYATLYYDNYLGNPCYKDTVSPVMAWKEANVSYAFYLVDENGNIIVNQTTGQTGSFANKVAVTNPVVYETVLLNNDEEVSSIDIASLGVLPEGYTLYDYNGTTGATYTVTINSNTTGAWKITSVKDVATTYVMQYDPDNATAYSNEVANETIGYDYTHTVVWFAVLWKVQALPDSVVIDYGLPVDISVLTNDMFGENGKLAGIGAYSDGLNLDGYDAALSNGFVESYTGTYGSATANTTTGKVRYTPSGMTMNNYEKFAYAVNYTGTTNPGYYYDTITVIPATTVYYEDDFLNYGAYGTGWEDVGTKAGDGIQDEDRPGAYSLTDANNIYGYDSVNLGMSTYSLGTAKKVHVDANSWASASFNFYGTGFDVISMTSNTTGVMTVMVYQYEEDGTKTLVKSGAVDTYYGYTAEYYPVTYTYDAEEGKWIETVGTKLDSKPTESIKALPENPVNGETVETWKTVNVLTPDDASALFQIPVIQIEDLPYGHYNAEIRASYAEVFDHTTDAGYDLYLDAIRIYNPAGDGVLNSGTDEEDTTIKDAYVADGEGWPMYIELRNEIIEANSFDNVANEALETDMQGIVFIDGDATIGDALISDYISYGPNNEVYLAKGQRVAFILNVPANVANVHIGIKSADGKPGTYTIANIAQEADPENSVEAGAYYGAKTYSINTTTDMYYDLTGWKNDIVVISNTGDKFGTDGIISITNIKFTFTSDPNEGIEPTGFFRMTPNAAALTLRTLNSAANVEETPETSESEENITEGTTPETNESEESTETEESESEESAETEESESEESTEAEESESEESTEAEESESEESTEAEENESEETETDKNENTGNTINEIITNIINKVSNMFSSLLSKWFR